MDYVFLSGLRPPLPKKIIVSYDIACQWEKNLPARCNSYSEFSVLKGEHGYELVMLVPKFHLPAHKGPCVMTHSFNLQPGVGRTDGEAPERGWAWSNRLAASTREMGPGNRRDTLDDCFGDANWTKTVGMGTFYSLFSVLLAGTDTSTASTLRERAENAIEMREAQTQAFREFAGGLTSQQRKDWTGMAQEWEQDKTSPNPYVNEQSGASRG